MGSFGHEGDRGDGVVRASFGHEGNRGDGVVRCHSRAGELQHGRLAMIAIGGMIHGSFVTGTGVFGGAN